MFARFASAHSRWATTAILLIGATLGVTVGSSVLAGLAGPDAVTAATTQSRSESCNAFGFVPVDSTTGSDYFNAKRIRAGTAGSGFFICNLALPARAVVTKVQFSIWDGSGSSEVKYCGLYRSGLDSTSFDTIQELAAVPATGIAQAPGFARLTDTTIQNSTIDNTNHSYWLQCNLGQYGQSLGIFGASVTYTITATNG
jgi:hypothetical protein